MSVSPEKRSGLQKRIRRLVAAQRAAEEDLLVAIYQATQDGASHRDVAYMIGQRPNSQSGIGPKALKGKAILDGRKRP